MSTQAVALAPAEKPAVAHAPEAAHAPAAGHGGHGGHEEHAAAHGSHGGRRKHEHEHKHHGPPPWLISFGDMMTLFLCFFIILVTMAPKQEAGLMARGLGPFVVALESHGMDGALSGAKSLNAVNDFRSRFGLTTINAEEFVGGKVEALNADEVKQLLDAALLPYTTLPQPLAARFTADSADLPASTSRYLDLMAESLRPGFGQVLVLEGHAGDASVNFQGNNALLALARAQAVKQYLVDKQGFIPQRVEARAWVVRTGELDVAPLSVDARLVQPIARDSSAATPVR